MINKKKMLDLSEASQASFKKPYELGKDLFGKYSSGRKDLARNHSKILKEILREKHKRQLQKWSGNR